MFYLFDVFSIFYSQNKFNGLDSAYSTLPIFLFPVFILLRKNIEISENIIIKCIYGFSFSLLIVVFVNFSSVVIDNSFNFYKITKLPGKFFSEGLVNYHYLYLSYYISISIVLLTYLYLYKRSKIYWINVLIISTILFFTFYLVILGSRNSIITCIIFSSILYFIWTYRNKKIQNFLLFCLLGTVSLLFLIYLEIPLIGKIKEAINYNNQYANLKKVWGGRMMREEIWSCCLKLIKEKPVFGYGLGSIQNEIDSCLAINSSRPELYLGRFKFNAHNQYLQTILNSGLFGFLSFILFIVYTTFKSYNYKNYIYIIFIGISMITFLTESILERNHGIIIFSFFSSLFYIRNYN